MNFFLILPNTFLKSFRCHSQGMEGGGNLKDVRCYSFYLFFFGTSSLNFKSPNIDFSSTWKLRYQRTKVAALFGGWGSEQKYRHFSCQGGGWGGVSIKMLTKCLNPPSLNFYVFPAIPYSNRSKTNLSKFLFNMSNFLKMLQVVLVGQYCRKQYHGTGCWVSC